MPVALGKPTNYYDLIGQEEVSISCKNLKESDKDQPCGLQPHVFKSQRNVVIVFKFLYIAIFRYL